MSVGACSGSGKSARRRAAETTTTERVTVGTSLQHFAGHGSNLTFDHPAAWLETFERADDPPSTMGGHPIVFLSNAKLRDPCTRTSQGAIVTVTCSYPIKVLPPGAVLVTWAMPEADLGVTGPPQPIEQGPQPTTTTIASQPYRTSVVRPGDCAKVRADETITATVGGYVMVACLRGPGSAENAALVREMLRSAQVTT